MAFATDSKPFLRVGVIYAPDGLPTQLPMEVEELLFAATRIFLDCGTDSKPAIDFW